MEITHIHDLCTMKLKPSWHVHFTYTIYNIWNCSQCSVMQHIVDKYIIIKCTVFMLKTHRCGYRSNNVHVYLNWQLHLRSRVPHKMFKVSLVSFWNNARCFIQTFCIWFGRSLLYSFGWKFTTIWSACKWTDILFSKAFGNVAQL